jgi:hypothetical protein
MNVLNRKMDGIKSLNSDLVTATNLWSSFQEIVQQTTVELQEPSNHKIPPQ